MSSRSSTVAFDIPESASNPRSYGGSHRACLHRRPHCCVERPSWTVLLIRCARLMVSADLVQRKPAADSTDESYITTQRG